MNNLKPKFWHNFALVTLLSLALLIIGTILGQLCTLPISYLLNKISIFNLHQSFYLMFLSLFSCLFVSLIFCLWVRFIEKQPLSFIGFVKDHWLTKYLTGLLIGFAMMSIVVIILLVSGHISLEKNNIQPTGISSLPFILILLIGWIIQGASEEIVTRGYLMNVLKNKYNVPVALLITSTLFGLLHLGNPSVNPIAIINIILVGLFFGLCTIKTNNLWLACGIHSAWNFAQGNIFGFEVSGIDTSVGSLIDLNLKGNTLITGGAFGPEAGLSSTIVLILSIGIILYLDKKGTFQKVIENKSIAK